jgi:hypothetical protein
MRHWIAMPIAAVVVTLAATLAPDARAWVAHVATAGAPAQLATPGTHYRTFIGTDFHWLDSDNVFRLAPNTGGGIWPYSKGSTSGQFLEVGVDLPDGATVTEITFYVRDCESLSPSTPYFGAYAPATGGFSYYVAAFVPPHGACDQTQSIVKAVNPPVTVDNSQQRYVIGYEVQVVYVTTTYDPNLVTQLLVGARVAYQAPGAFMPVVQR